MKRCAYMPIGVVNLITGKNALFGNIWSGWEEDATATNMLVVEDKVDADAKPKYYVVHTCGSGWEPGTTLELKHDQTFRPKGWGWTVVACTPHTLAGLKQLAEITARKSLAFCTLK